MDDDDTELVGDFECGLGRRAVCDFEEEVVLDSEDERIDQCQTSQVTLADGSFNAKGAGGHGDVLELDIGKRNQLKSYAKELDSSDVKCMESQLSTESFQENALKFVDSFLSYSDFTFSPQCPSTKMTRERSRVFLPAKGIQDVAKRINLIRSTKDMDPFEWVDTATAEDAADVQASFYYGDLDKGVSKVKSAALCPQSTGNDAFPNESADDLESVYPKRHRVASVRSSSAVLQYISDQSGQTSKVNGDIVENCGNGSLDNNLVAETLGKQVQYVSVAEEEYDDIGFCTQMAAEVMETLAHAPSCITTDFPEVQWHTPPRSPQELNAHVAGSEKLASKENVFPDSRKRQQPAKTSVTTTSPFNACKKQRLNTKLELLSSAKNANVSTGRSSRRNLSSPSRVSGRRAVKYKKRTEDMGHVKSNQMKVIDHHKRKFPSSKQEEIINSSAVSHRTRQFRSGNKQKERVKNSENCSGRGKSSSMDSNNLKRLKQVYSRNDLFEGGSGMHGSDEPGVARTRGVNLEKQTEVGFSLLTTLETWNYPKRKRTKCNIQRGRDGAGSLYAVTIAKGRKNVEISNISQFARSSNFVHPSDGVAEGDLLIQERFRSDREEDDSLMCHSKVKSSKKPTLKQPHSDDKDGHAFLVGKNSKEGIAVENEILLGNSEGNPANALAQKSTAGKDLTRQDYQKEPCKKSLAKSYMSKELMRLGTNESMPDFTWKNLRKRRYMAHVCVLLSLHLGDKIVKKQKEILAKLRIPIATSSSDASHFIADKFTRTRNMFEFIAEGKPVVTHLWLECCGEVGFLVDEKKFILRDAIKEKEFGFNMATSLARAAKHPLLEGWKVFITPNIKPDKEMITNLVKAVRGQVINRRQIPITEQGHFPDDILIISCVEDKTAFTPFLKKGAKIYSPELILSGIVTQKLDYKRHELVEANSIDD